MAAAKKTRSGEHPEVKAMKAEMRSIRNELGGRINRLNERLQTEVAKIKSDAPVDPRRESDDPIPVDIVRIPRAPLPSNADEELPPEAPTRKIPRP